MTSKIKTFAYNPRIQLLVMFALIAIYTTRCGDAYR
jgi:hypothetical protein